MQKPVLPLRTRILHRRRPIREAHHHHVHHVRVDAHQHDLHRAERTVRDVQVRRRFKLSLHLRDLVRGKRAEGHDRGAQRPERRLRPRRVRAWTEEDREYVLLRALRVLRNAERGLRGARYRRPVLGRERAEVLHRLRLAAACGLVLAVDGALLLVPAPCLLLALFALPVRQV